jgi:hypothetical protein
MQMQGLNKTTAFELIISNLDMNPLQSKYKPIFLILTCTPVVDVSEPNRFDAK